VREVADRVCLRSPNRLRVAVDGWTTAGKTSFGHELHDDLWDYRIWLDIDAELALARGISRDREREGGEDAAARLHRDRYHAAEEIYLAEVQPQDLADIVIDNRVFENPRIMRERGCLSQPRPEPERRPRPRS
jgi:hypothetical protein